MKRLLVLGVFPLCGCITSERIVDRPVYVDRIVTEPCVVRRPVAPRYAVDAIKKTDALDAIVKAYAIDRRQRIVYIAELDAVIAGCLPNE